MGVDDPSGGIGGQMGVPGRGTLGTVQRIVTVGLVGGREYRFGEWMPLKAAFAVFGLVKARRSRSR